MTTRTRTFAAVAVAAAVLLTGCGSESDDRMDQAAEAARAYQEAVLAQDWTAACEAKTARLRGGTVADCVERSESAPARDEETTTGLVTTGEPFDVEAAGEHPAGVGLLVSYDIDHGGSSTDTARNALRLVEHESAWLVEQTVTLDEGDGTSTEAVRTALRER